MAKKAKLTPAQLRAKQERAELVKEFRKFIGKQRIVECVLRNVSSNGMSRIIDFYIIKKGCAFCINHYIHRLTGCNYTRSSGWRGSITVGGCGMDMGFAVVYDLSHNVFKKTKRTPDPGYQLKHHWM